MTSSTPRLEKAARLGLAAMGVAVLVIANDFTALSVAIPSIEKTFGADLTTSQWVINGYALVFGVAIVTGGRLADMYGRRRVFFIGCTLFAAFSLVGGAAGHIAVLLAARALMGVGGALMWPAIMGMTYALLPKGKEGLAGGLILGAAGFGNAVGPLIGGALTDSLGWRWIFLLNLPIAAFAILVTWRVIRPDDATIQDRRLDWPGVLTLSVGLLSLLLALDQGTDDGWTNPRILSLFALSAVALAGFVFVERRAGARALIPQDVRANRAFFAACMTVLLMSAIFFAALLYVPQFMMKTLGYSAGESRRGAAADDGSFRGHVLRGRSALCPAGAEDDHLRGRRVPRGRDVSPVVRPAELGLCRPRTRDDRSGDRHRRLYSSVTTAAVTALDPSRAGVAGIVYMFQIGGGSIGLGLNTAIVASSPVLAEGMRNAFRVDAALAVCGLLVAALFVGGTVDFERLRNLRYHHRAHG